MRIKIVTLLILSLTGFSAAHAGAEGGSGGVFVKVNGKWVMIDEARAAYETTVIGLQDLISEDCLGESRCTSPTYGRALKPWLDFLSAFEPGLTREIMIGAETVEFRIVNNELAYVPADLPKAEVKYEAMKKAAIYRVTKDKEKVVWVSRPVMDLAGSLGAGRLTGRENQGLLLLHEMFNIRFVRNMEHEYERTYIFYAYWRDTTMSAQRISDLGTELVHVYTGKSTPEDYFFNLYRRKFSIFNDRGISLNYKAAVINELDRRKLDGVYSYSQERECVQTILGLQSGGKSLDDLVGSYRELYGFLNLIDFCNRAYGIGFENEGPDLVPKLLDKNKLKEMLVNGKFRKVSDEPGDAKYLRAISGFISDFKYEERTAYPPKSLSDIYSLFREIVNEEIEKQLNSRYAYDLNFVLESLAYSSSNGGSYNREKKIKGWDTFAGTRHPSKLNCKSGFGTKTCSYRMTFHYAKWTKEESFDLEIVRVEYNLEQITHKETRKRSAWKEDKLQIEAFLESDGTKIDVDSSLKNALEGLTVAENENGVDFRYASGRYIPPKNLFFVQKR